MDVICYSRFQPLQVFVSCSTLQRPRVMDMVQVMRSLAIFSPFFLTSTALLGCPIATREIDPIAPQRSLGSTSRTAGTGCAPSTLHLRLWDGVRDRGENLLHIRSALRARLEEQETLLLRILPPLLGADLPRIAFLRTLCIFAADGCCGDLSAAVSLAGGFGEIDFIAHQRDDDAGACLALELGYPVFGFYEGGWFG